MMMLWSTRDDMEQLYGDPLEVWRPWCLQITGHGIDSTHHIAEQSPADVIATRNEPGKQLKAEGDQLGSTRLKTLHLHLPRSAAPWATSSWRCGDLSAIALSLSCSETAVPWHYHETEVGLRGQPPETPVALRAVLAQGVGYMYCPRIRNRDTLVSAGGHRAAVHTAAGTTVEIASLIVVGNHTSRDIANLLGLPAWAPSSSLWGCLSARVA
jgi:hypothetical protein